MVTNGAEAVSKYDLEDRKCSFVDSVARRLEPYDSVIWLRNSIQSDLRSFPQLTGLMAMFTTGTSTVLKYEQRNRVGLRKVDDLE